jgi:hypothetical protein
MLEVLTVARLRRIRIDLVNRLQVERDRQIRKWGDQRHPDGTSSEFTADANFYRASCDDHAREGVLTWSDILLEEVWEALSETEPAKLESELVQVGAVVLAWLEDIRRR